MKRFLSRLVIFLEILIIFFSFFNLAFTGRVFPNVFVAGVGLGGKNEAEAIELLGKTVKIPEILNLVSEGQSFEITSASIDLLPDYTKSVKAAFNFHRTGNPFFDFYQRLLSLSTRTDLGIRFSLDKAKLNKTVSVIAGQIGMEPVFPSLKIIGEKVIADSGKAGFELDQELLKIKIGEAFAFTHNYPINLPLKKIDPSLTQDQATVFQARGEKLFPKTLILISESQRFSYKGRELLKYLKPASGYEEGLIADLIGSLAKEINREPQNSVFVFEEGKVQEFMPAKDGLTLQADSLKQMITGNLRTLEETEENTVSINIPVTITPPAIKTGDVNNLGIKELVGRGTSSFTGSIPGRIHNIKLASSRFKGVLVAPGENFSFNKTLGDVSVYTGYKQAYIIKEGKTILGDGGGVCQVSTTLFRAVLNSGLPIRERKAHAYRVGYYEQGSPPGLDATVYDPTTDFKFTNDTGNYLLIQTEFDPKKAVLAFEIYGTKDGRTAEITKPKITEITPPPEDFYQDDPTLPLGSVKQIEHKAWGAKVTFKYTVSKNGETVIDKTFVSNYRPWQAVFLRGTGNANN